MGRTQLFAFWGGGEGGGGVEGGEGISSILEIFPPQIILMKLIIICTVNFKVRIDIHDNLVNCFIPHTKQLLLIV